MFEVWANFASHRYPHIETHCDAEHGYPHDGRDAKLHVGGDDPGPYARGGPIQWRADLAVVAVRDHLLH